MICANPKCNKEIQVTENYFLLAFDRPYINLYFHRNCGVRDLEILAEIIEGNNEGSSNKGSRVRGSRSRVQP